MAIPLLLTLKVSFTATLSALVAGVGLAYVFARRRGVASDILGAFVSLPMVLPPTVLGYYLIVFMGRRGVFGTWLYDIFGASLLFTWQGAAVASAIVSLPLVFGSARAAFETVDHTLEEAAATLGLNPLAVFWRVSLPLAARGIAAGTLLAFARAFGEFGATLMVAGNLPGRTQTLSLAVYSAVEAGDDALAAKLVLLTSVACVTLLVVSGRLLRQGG